MATTVTQAIGIPEQELWQAVMTRDGRYDSRFVFGVLSTMIYCNPSCPSRRPRREQVVFFTEPREAEAGGFRACMRCRPRGESATSLRRDLVKELCNFIDSNPDRRMTLDTLSRHVGISPFHLQRIFKDAVGITPRQYIEKSKLDRSKLLLKIGESVRRSTYDSGHNSTSWLYSRRTDALGMSPGAYKKGGAGMRIGYCILGCSLGRVLVGWTERGVCAVSLGTSDDRLESFLRTEYPRAEIRRSSAEVSEWVNRIVKYIDGGEAVQLNSLPLDIRATSFQYRVWKAIQSIPYGSTLSYSELAKRIGARNATRAVANACAANPVALVVPCHRVVRKDNELGGYRWGLGRKQSLLKKESEIVASMANE